MRRKRLWKNLAIVSGFVAIIVVTLIVLAKSEPKFYAESEIPPGETRAQLSNNALASHDSILEVLVQEEWRVSFSAAEINAFLQEDYYNLGGDDNLPENCSSPRVKIEDGKMRIGVRYGKGLFSTIASIELRLWKVPGQINTVALEIISFRAGSLPLPTSSLLDGISERVRRDKFEISWFRDRGNPVAIMRFQSDLSRPTFQFDKIELKDGKLNISGRSADFVPGPVPRAVEK